MNEPRFGTAGLADSYTEKSLTPPPSPPTRRALA